MMSSRGDMDGGLGPVSGDLVEGAIAGVLRSEWFGRDRLPELCDEPQSAARALFPKLRVHDLVADFAVFEDVVSIHALAGEPRLLEYAT